MDSIRNFFILVAACATMLLAIVAYIYYFFLLCTDENIISDDIRVLLFETTNITRLVLDLEQWISMLPPGKFISDGNPPYNAYVLVGAPLAVFAYSLFKISDTIRVTSYAVYHYILEDEIPQAQTGQTIIHSYINCYEAMSDNTKWFFEMMLLDGWFFGTISRIVHFVVTAAWLVFWNFPSDGTKVHFYLLAHVMVTIIFYICQIMIITGLFANCIKLFYTTNVWSFAEMRELFFYTKFWHHSILAKLMLFNAIVYTFVSTLIRRRMDRLVFDHKPNAKLVERDSKNFKKVFDMIVDQAFEMVSKKGEIVLEATMPQSDYHTATCPKWQVFFTADSVVIGSGFVCKRGIITVLHVYQVLTSEARAGKEIRIVGPKGSVKFPKHQLQLSVEVSETIAIKVEPSLYAIIGAKSTSIKSIKPSTPGPVFIYGHKDGVMKRTMGALTGQSDTGVLNHSHTSSTLAGWSGSPLFRGDSIVGIHRGSNGTHNICENVYVGLGCHRAAVAEIRDLYRQTRETPAGSIVLEAFGDALTTPSLTESGRQLMAEIKADLRAARQEEAQERHRNVADEAARKIRIYRDMVEYDSDLADMDSGTLMEIYADLQVFGSLTPEQEDILGVRARTLAKGSRKKNGGAVSDESRSNTTEAPRVSPVSVLVPKPVVLESDSEPPSDFQSGPEGSTVKTQSSSSNASASQATQERSSTKTSGPSSQSQRKSQQRSPIPLVSPTVVITPPVTILPPEQAHQQFPTPRTVTTLTRAQRKAINSSIKDLEAKLQAERLLLASDTNQARPNRPVSSPQQPSNQPSVATNTPTQGPPPSAGV